MNMPLLYLLELLRGCGNFNSFLYERAANKLIKIFYSYNESENTKKLQLEMIELTTKLNPMKLIDQIIFFT